ncbi:MAG: hypothetical protein RL325_783 [Planctomycetota bacterium]
MMHRYSPDMRPAPRGIRSLVHLLALVCVVAVQSVRADPPAATEPGKDQAKQEERKKDEPRSLDDLLGVPESDAAGASAEDAARREQEKRFEKSLDEASMSDLMQRAVDGMKTASERLTDGKDAGLGTQRIQEDVVKTLDRLLQEAQRRQSKSSSSKSSSKRNAKDDPSEKNGQQQKQRQQQQRQRSASTQSSTSGDQESAEGTRDDAVAEMQELTESRIEWGRLPERVRELVLQGRRDRVSTIYERLTREYYKRLAEEASR